MCTSRHQTHTRTQSHRLNWRRCQQHMHEFGQIFVCARESVYVCCERRKRKRALFVHFCKHFYTHNAHFCLERFAHTHAHAHNASSVFVSIQEWLGVSSETETECVCVCKATCVAIRYRNFYIAHRILLARASELKFSSTFQSVYERLRVREVALFRIPAKKNLPLLALY